MQCTVTNWGYSSRYPLTMEDERTSINIIYIYKCNGPTEDSCLQMKYVAGNKGNNKSNCANRKNIWRLDGTVKDCSNPNAISFITRIQRNLISNWFAYRSHVLTSNVEYIISQQQNKYFTYFVNTKTLVLGPYFRSLLRSRIFLIYILKKYCFLL
jgi:hypothetical protein